MAKTSGWNKELGERVRAGRISRGLTQEELAYRAGVSTVHLRSIERGASGPSFTMMARIGRVLGTSLDDLAVGVLSYEEQVEQEFDALKRDPSFSSQFAPLLLGKLDLKAKESLLQTFRRLGSEDR